MKNLSLLLATFFSLHALAEAPASIYEIPLKTITGEATTLSPYKNKVMLIVNTASKCGNTPQYTALEADYAKYKAKGFVVLGFPSNDFLGQEPGENKDIKKFCELNYKVTFPLFEKGKVRGDNKQPLYAYLLAHEKSSPEIRWNFEKFLVDGKGEIVARFKPGVQPDAPEVIAAIEKALSTAKP